MFMKLNKKKGKRGFTLIELIVVIAILAIIAAIALPAFNNLRDSSAQRVADANARTAYTAILAAQALGDNLMVSGTLTSATGVDFAGDVATMLGDDFFAEAGTEVSWDVTAAAGATPATLNNVTYTATIDGHEVEGIYPAAGEEEEEVTP